MTTITLESCKISPPPADTPTEFSLPILFFDMLWYDMDANRCVHFFELPSYEYDQYLDTIVPQLKTSLSHTLTHFLPLAGNIIHPIKNKDKNMPIIRYQSGDSISLTISESKADFNHLTGDHPRSCDDFYAFTPDFPPAAIHSENENSVSCPVLAIQVTLFPGNGLSIGLVIHHAIADASTTAAFLQAWALINRTTRNNTILNNIVDELKLNNCFPFYDRKDVVNLNGLDSLYWDLTVQFGCSVEPPPVKLPINKHRATLTLKKDEIQKLRNLLSVNCPAGMTHASSFTVICALVWVCSSKAASIYGGDVADDEPAYLGFTADCRGRLNPPLPPNYFGNCVALVNAVLKHGEVINEEEGFVMAAKAIGKAIKENVYNEKGILHNADKWPEEYEKLVGKRQYGVSGSPRFDFYAVDYGWGKPKKFEILSIDGGDSMSLCKSREFEGGLEIGVTKPVAQLESFATIFTEVLSKLLE